MKRFLCLAAMACATLLWAGRAAGAVIISEYVEGSGNNKAIELYNVGPAAVDLSGSFVRVYFNGSATALTNLALSATLLAGATWVIAHPSASFAASADQTSSALSFNGNDAIVLESAGAVVDRIGQVGFDPGSEWGSGLASTANNTLRRKPAVLSGDSDALTAFDPSLQWVGFPQDTVDGLGAHQVLAVPEPRAWLLMACGMVLLAGARRLGPRAHGNRPGA